MGRPYDAARAMLDLGQALAASGQAVQASAYLDRVLATLESLAEELSDEGPRAAFLQSQMVQLARQARAGLPVSG